MRTKAAAAVLLAAIAISAAAIDLQGHRGTRGLAPENTLAAFKTALAIGVTTLETDLALTRDGVLVLSHEPHLYAALTRGSDGKWLTEDGDDFFAEREADPAEYDIGRLNPAHKYAEQWTAQKPSDGERIRPCSSCSISLATPGRRAGGRCVSISKPKSRQPVATAHPTPSATRAPWSMPFARRR